MLEPKIARRYAEGLFGLAQEQKAVEIVERELLKISQMLAENSEVRLVMEHPKVPLERKQSLAKRLFAPVLSPMTLNFVQLLIAKRRLRLIEHIIEEFVRLSRESRGVVSAIVKTAVELTQEEKERLHHNLKRLLAQKVELEPQVDPSVIGGVAIRVNDTLIDDTIATKIELLAKELRKTK